MRNENIYQSIMPAVYIVADNIYSPIGATTDENFERVKQGISGIKKHSNPALADEDIHVSLFNSNEIQNIINLNTATLKVYL
jgi:vesicle coat complex subunit